MNGMRIVFAGTLDDVDLGKPEAELWVRCRVGWLAPVEGAAQMQEFTLEIEQARRAENQYLVERFMNSRRELG